MREANLSVEAVSLRWRASGQMFATITVLQFPPIESRRKLVSFAWRYGTCPLFLLERARTTCSRKLRDLLMKHDSSRVTPTDPVFLVISLPAKSTRWSFEKTTLSADSTRERLSTCKVKTVWARDEAAFRLCALTVWFIWPSNKQFRASSSFWQTCWVRPRIATPPRWSSVICRF